MKNIILAFLALIIVGVSCKKSSSATEEPKKYLSLSAGSTWNYEIQNNISASTTTNIVSSSTRDSSINGKSYHIFTNSNGTANEYLNITLNDYWTFRILAPASGISSVETIYLKDNTTVGSSWAQTLNVPVAGFPAPIPVIFTNTITEKGVSRTVNGNNYTDVIHTTTTISVSGLPPGSITTDIQSYYAPVIGLIESKNKILIPLLTINADQNTLLKTANIK